MKLKRLFWICVMTVLVCGVCRADAPHGVGGFVLGHSIADYRDRVDMSTDLPIRHMEYLREVEIRPIDGFKSGLIHYGTCHVPGTIVRIKLKYADSRKAFFDQLLKRFKDRFGAPSEWRGDPFHIVIAWKWSFTDPDGNRISLVLQHNTKDVEEKLGNSVKMALTNIIEKERACYLKKTGESESDRTRRQRRRENDAVDWNLFIPR